MNHPRDRSLPLALGELFSIDQFLVGKGALVQRLKPSVGCRAPEGRNRRWCGAGENAANSAGSALHLTLGFLAILALGPPREIRGHSGGYAIGEMRRSFLQK